MNIEIIQQFVNQASLLHITNNKTNSTSHSILDMSLYAGIIEYRPEELVMTAKAGTTIQSIKKILLENSQSLPFYANNATTIGASYAIGNPELRDAMLGVKIVDGQGQQLTFGGQVIKNVAGYDVPRLLVGSKGLLAVICEISFKVLPTAYINPINDSPVATNHPPSEIKQQLEQGLKNVFDPNNIFI